VLNQDSLGIYVVPCPILKYEKSALATHASSLNVWPIIGIAWNIPWLSVV
jgi:hypothetical protein